MAKLLGPRYTVVTHLGQGSSGQVSLLWDNENKRNVVVKIFSYPSNVRELIGVGGVLHLRHPGLIEILGHEVTRDGFAWYFMPPADDVTGGPLDLPGTYIQCTLDRYLEKNPDVSLADRVGVVLELCHAMAYLHSQGFIHRDIKAANIVRVDGKWKLADIGLLARIGSYSRVGTRGFVPPEGHGEPAGDLYSLGMLLKQMLPSNWVSDSCKGSGRRPANAVERRLLRIVLKATQKRHRRYRSAKAMRKDLEKVQRMLRKRDLA